MDEFCRWCGEVWPSHHDGEACPVIDRDQVLRHLRSKAVSGDVEVLKTFFRIYLKDRARAPHSVGKFKPRKLCVEENEKRVEFSDWWMSAAWPRFHDGATYGFEGERDGPAVLRLLRHPKVKWDLERAKSVALYYLKLQDAYLVHAGKPLPTLAARVNYYASKLDQLNQQGASHVIGIAGNVADADAAHNPARGAGPAGADTYAIPAGRRAGVPRAGDGPAGQGGAAAAAG